MTTFYHSKGNFPAHDAENIEKISKKVEKTMDSVYQNLPHSTQLEIQLDKKEYVGGDMVSGDVVMTAYEPMEAKAIYLDFKGIEEVGFFIFSRSCDANSKQAYPKDLVIADRRFELFSGLHTFPPGTHTFPFKFKLDTSLPTSVSFCEAWNIQKISGSIKYTMDAIAVRPCNQDVDISISLAIPIHCPLEIPIQPIQALKDANITRFCCIDMGMISCSALLDKNAYKPGELAKLTLSIDNSASDVDLKDISFKLIHNCICLFLNRYNRCSRKRVTSKVKCENSAPRVPKNRFASMDLELQLPHDLIPSTNGELVKSTYKFEIEIGVPYSPNVILTLPIEIIKH